MNYNFDLRDINNFNTDHLSETEKRNILNIFNLNKFKYVLNVLKNFDLNDTDASKLEEEKQKVLQQAKINFIINNSKFVDKIIIGNTYYLYKNEDDEYWSSLVEPNTLNTDSKFIEGFKLQEDLTWVSLSN